MEPPSTPTTTMNRAASTRMSLVLHDIAHRLIRIRCRSLQHWHQRRIFHQRRLVMIKTQKEARDDGAMAIILTLPTRIMATFTKMNTIKEILSILISKPSSQESKLLLKTTFNKSSKQKFVEVGKFQNADLAQNVLLLTVITSYLQNSTFIKIIERNNARISIKIYIAPMETAASSTTT